ncbi:DUF4349 domain-containing protein [uncultured Clostridium sp.]|uniref:DUF4349 domain-containing protein n=1 Tax=uncultured Clostridium sp. TaxID=59620 RepID=UPI0025F10FE3|nr:DUF4349 domain-containing protein [uncultured Clostridium sp.]
MKNRNTIRSIFLLLGIGILLTACGSSSAKISAGGNAQEAMLYHEVPQATEAAQAMKDEYRSDSSEEADPVTSSGGIHPVDTQRKLIRTVSMSLESTQFDSLMESITKKVTELGGYIENSNISGSSIRYGSDRNQRSAQITARIPADNLPAFITEVEENGNVTGKQEAVEDVTLSYADVESRKKTLEVEQERLWELLEKADTTEAIITLESRLSEIRYQLESYESQLRLMANQVSYSTVNLYVDEVSLFTPTKEETVGQRIRRGFLENLESVGKALTDLLVWLISTSPAIVLCLAVFFGIWMAVKKYAGRKENDSGEEGMKEKKRFFKRKK